jgi:hypothetical protein
VECQPEASSELLGRLPLKYGIVIEIFDLNKKELVGPPATLRIHQVLQRADFSGHAAALMCFQRAKKPAINFV